jgi:hypothetical protein
MMQTWQRINMANPFSFILQSFALQHMRPKVYSPGRKIEGKQNDYSGAGVRPIAELDYNMSTLPEGKIPTSMLGTPVFCDLILRDQTGGIELRFDWILAEVNQSKNIVKTAIEGRAGTVKEYIADGDYDVRLRGGLFTPFSRAYPKTDMQALMALLKLSESLKVTSEYLVLFGIYELVVERYSFPQGQGTTNVQLFDLSCVSDEPINLRKANG